MSDLEVQNTKLSDRIIANLYRPVMLFAFEAIAILFTLYLTVVYIVLFTFLTGMLLPYAAFEDVGQANCL